LGNHVYNPPKVRVALGKIDSDIPIHVFGSLDPISTPLYFLVGADYFDGLTWLRYAYLDGYAVYNHNFGATELNLSERADQMKCHINSRNFNYLKKLQDQMRQFLVDKDFDCFEHHGDFFKKSVRTTEERLREK